MNYILNCSDVTINNISLIFDELGIENFIDIDFPPLNTSINTGRRDLTDREKEILSTLIFKRLNNKVKNINLSNDDNNNNKKKKKGSLFGKNITYSDLKQGSLGNCGFGASLVALCKYPKLIYKLFDFENINDKKNNYKLNVKYKINHFMRHVSAFFV